MGQSTFPIPSSGGTSTSTVLPVNASSVLVDGSLTSASSFSTTLSSSGIAYLQTQTNPAKIAIGSSTYYTMPGVVYATGVIGSSQSTTISALTPLPSPSSFVTVDTSAFVINTYALTGNSSGTFVASGLSTGYGATNNFQYSTNNGLTWTTGTFPNSNSWNSSAHSGTYFFIVAGGGNTATNYYVYSTNGTSFGLLTLPTSAQWYVTAGNGNVIFYASVGTTTGYYSSTTSVTSVTFPQVFNSIYYGNSLFMAFSYNSSTSGNLTVYTSPTGATWTAKGVAPFSISPNGVAGNPYCAYGNGVWCISSGVTSATSANNGTTWTVSKSNALTASGGGIAFINNFFYILSPSQFPIYYCNDGLNWVSTNIQASTSSITCVYAANNTIVTLAYSPSTTGGQTIAIPSTGSVLPVNYGIYAGPTTIY